MSKETNMEEVLKHVRALEEMGCAVVVFTPEELKDVDPDKVQDRLIELGNEVINDMAWFYRDEDVDNDDDVKLESWDSVWSKQP